MIAPSDQDLRRMLAEATPIPWCGADCENGHLECREIGYIGHIELHSPGSPFVRSEAEKDARLIVAAVNALPAHLDEIARLKGEVAAAKRDAEEAKMRANRSAADVRNDLLPKLKNGRADAERLAGLLREAGERLGAEFMTDSEHEIADRIKTALAGLGGRKEGGE